MKSEAIMILIYGNGELLKIKSKLIDWSKVSAIVDKNTSIFTTHHQVDIIKPESINNYSFHSIFIFSISKFEEIKFELIHIL